MLETNEQLGELSPLYQEYRDIIDPIDLAAKVQIPYRQEVIEDNLKKARENLPIDCDQETYEIAIRKAHYATYSAREHLLISKGFVGSILGIFKEIDGLFEASPTPELLGKTSLYEHIPANHRKGAGIVTKLGYYWSGKYIPFNR